jgi:GUN4-like
MLQFLIGLSLSLYSAFVLKTLTDWRKNVLGFVKDILDSGKDLLNEGQQLLDPVKDAADATRNSASYIDDIAGSLKNDLPPRLQQISQNAENANAALIELQPVISEAIRELPANVVVALNLVVDFLESRSPDVKALAEDIKKVRLIIDDPNAANDEDIVAIVEKIAKELYDKDKPNDSSTISNSLKDAGKELDNAAEALGALAFVIVGSSAPLTLSVLTTLSAVSFIKPIVDALAFKKGSLLSISLRFPTSDIGRRIDLPRPLSDIDVNLVNAGELIDRKIQVPERDTPLLAGVTNFLKDLDDAKKQAQKALNASKIAQDITLALNATGQGLKNIGGKVEEASTNLLETSEAIVEFAPVLDNTSTTLTKFSEDFASKASEIKPISAEISQQSENLQKAVDKDFPVLTTSIGNIITVVKDLDVVTPLGKVQDTATEIRKIANLIDNGQPLDSQDKNDFRQKINNILKILANVLRTGESFDKLFKPLYLIILALHLLSLIAGLVLIFNSGILSKKEPPLPIPSPTISPLPDDLSSDKGIDYTQLRDLIREKKWEEANQLTSVLFLKVADQEQQGYLVNKDTQNLACKDLRTINQLWMRYSDNHFGLSVQARLWESIGGATSYDRSSSDAGYQLSRRFEGLVGWNSSQGNSAIAPGAVPDGYLPFRPSAGGGSKDAWGGWWISAISGRLKSCEIR